MKTTKAGELELRNAGDRTSWGLLEATRPGEAPSLVYRVSLEDALAGPGGGQARSGTARRRKSTVFVASKEPEGGEIAPEPVLGSWKRKGLPDRLKRILPLLLHELAELEGFDEKEIRYGDERASALLPKI